MASSLNSAGEMLQLVRSGRARTRGELQRMSGLARSTVTTKVDVLLSAGYLVEDGSLIDGRGRPATRLRVNDHDLDLPGGRSRRDPRTAGREHRGG